MPNQTLSQTAAQVQALLNSVAALQALTPALSYSFTVNYDANGYVTSVSNLPTGWSAAITPTSDTVTITHNVGKNLNQINYWGVSAILGGANSTKPTNTYKAINISTTQFSINVPPSLTIGDTLCNVAVVF